VPLPLPPAYKDLILRTAFVGYGLTMIPCTFRQLEIFLAAAEDCHFVRTANRLGISQPAVTHHILALESQLGRQLFVRRKGTTPVLSSDGIAFLDQAKQVLDQGAKINSFRRSDQALRREKITLGAGAHILDDYIKPHMHELFAEDPEVTVDCLAVETITSGQALVRKGLADLFVFSANQPDVSDLHSEVIRRVRFGLYASPAFAEHRHASPAEIGLLPFVLPAEGTAVDKMVQDALARAGVVCRDVAIRAPYSDVIVELVKNGFGLGALFETMVAEQIESGDLIQFDVELPPRFRTIYRLNRPQSPAVLRVENFLRRILQ